MKEASIHSVSYTHLRQYLVKALFELLEHKNYHDITIGRLAQKANISRRTFYRCFRTKDDVMKYTSAPVSYTHLYGDTAESGEGRRL